MLGEPLLKGGHSPVHRLGPEDTEIIAFYKADCGIPKNNHVLRCVTEQVVSIKHGFSLCLRGKVTLQKFLK